ncbi:MAG TPA: hypothetical protein VNM37_03235, partial [Candidatus Dormibacteraeota bacterium]|nr:hypothetical protein [Candidatus Dormibacteraeota bacterium]
MKLDNCREGYAYLQKENARLKQDLKDYGTHQSPRCEYFGECICGLNEALGLGPAVPKGKP